MRGRPRNSPTAARVAGLRRGRAGAPASFPVTQHNGPEKSCVIEASIQYLQWLRCVTGASHAPPPGPRLSPARPPPRPALDPPPPRAHLIVLQIAARLSRLPLEHGGRPRCESCCALHTPPRAELRAPMRPSVSLGKGQTWSTPTPPPAANSKKTVRRARKKECVLTAISNPRVPAAVPGSHTEARGHKRCECMKRNARWRRKREVRAKITKGVETECPRPWSDEIIGYDLSRRGNVCVRKKRGGGAMPQGTKHNKAPLESRRAEARARI